MITAWQRLDDGSDMSVRGYRKNVHKQFMKSDGQLFDADIMDVDGNQAACTIALDTRNRIIIARQFRCGPEKVLDEMPAGLIEADETPLEAAKREMLEEVGYTSNEWRELGSAYVNAWSNTVHHYFLATNCTPAESNNPDEHEEIEVTTITITDFIENAKGSRMTDAQGVLMAYEYLKELEENA